MVPTILEKSWQSKPIVGIRAFTDRGSQKVGGCPVEYPEDIMYDIWPGTRGMCDCLEREGDRRADMNEMCLRGKD